MSEERSMYNYVPSTAAAITFLTLYGISTVTHLVQAVSYRTYWLIATAAFCGIIEILGWSGRLWSSYSPLLKIPFQIQICCTIVAPTPLLAANFVIFGQAINLLGPQYSRLSPHLYTTIFCACDVASLVIQGIGGGLAATATNLQDANRGGNVMLGGIAFQLAVIVAFALFFMEFMIRYARRSPIRRELDAPTPASGSNGTLNGHKGFTRGILTRKISIMLGAVSFVTLLLFIRAIYRTIELADGWTGWIIATELYFNVLDGGMVTIAMFTYNFFHPGYLLPCPKDKVVQEKENMSVDP